MLAGPFLLGNECISASRRARPIFDVDFRELYYTYDFAEVDLICTFVRRSSN